MLATAWPGPLTFARSWGKWQNGPMGGGGTGLFVHCGHNVAEPLLLYGLTREVLLLGWAELHVRCVHAGQQQRMHLSHAIQAAACI